MASKKKLGKGLSEIFGEDIDSVLNDISNGDISVKTSSAKLEIKNIRPNPYQPRKEFDEKGLNELADSIKENGVFQPILVRKSLSGYELVAGERRLRASKLAGKKDIPVIIVDFDDKQMMEISLLENIQRKNLTPIEEANAYEQLIKKLNYTQDELAKRIGKSRSDVTNMLRLLKLPEEVKRLISNGSLSGSQARTILSLNNEEKIIELARRTCKEGLSVRELEQLTKKVKEPIQKKSPVRKDPYLTEVKDVLQSKFGTKVEIKNKSIIIKYTNTKDLNRILEIMDALDD